MDETVVDTRRPKQVLGLMQAEYDKGVYGPFILMLDAGWDDLLSLPYMTSRFTLRKRLLQISGIDGIGVTTIPGMGVQLVEVMK